MMKASENIIAMIPARRGSQRLKQKNLALLNGRPLISYAIEAAVGAKVFSKVVVNSEDMVFKAIADEYNIDFYQRPTEWATSQARSDEVVLDFMQHHDADAVVWVNPTSPLQTAEELNSVVTDFIKKKYDSAITVLSHQVHATYEGRPLNFVETESFAPTQSLKPVQTFVYSAMMWRTKVFLQAYQERRSAILCGQVGYIPVSRESAVIIKTAEDLKFAEAILAGRNLKTADVQYAS